jgi:hypothetical protein
MIDLAVDGAVLVVANVSDLHYAILKNRVPVLRPLLKR